MLSMDFLKKLAVTFQISSVEFVVLWPYMAFAYTDIAALCIM